MKDGKRLRKGSRNKSALSTKHIFNYKNAKAQASQIYQLRRRIDRVLQKTKPEVKVVETSRTERMILPNVNDYYAFINFVRPELGSADNQRIGSKIHMIQPTLFISAKYDAVTQSNPAPVYNQQLLSGGAALRIIAIQTKTPLNDPPPLTSILRSNPSYSFQGVDNIANLTIPFEVGITTKYEIIYDKVKYFSVNKPIYSKRINFKPKIKNLKWNPGPDVEYTYPVGSIFVYIIQGGLESNNANVDTEGNDYTRITISYSQKLAYTDA